MEVRQRALSAIKPYAKNAKRHDEFQVQKIAASIKEFGFNQPIVVDKEGVIIVGHGRYEAAHSLGMKLVPTLEVDLTEEQAKAYRLADNKLNESGWDMELVVPELKELSAEMVELTGFDRELLVDRSQLPPDDSKKDEKCPRCEEIERSIEGHRRHTGHGPKVTDVPEELE